MWLLAFCHNSCQQGQENWYGSVTVLEGCVYGIPTNVCGTSIASACSGGPNLISSTIPSLPSLDKISAMVEARWEVLSVYQQLLWLEPHSPFCLGRHNSPGRRWGESKWRSLPPNMEKIKQSRIHFQIVYTTYSSTYMILSSTIMPMMIILWLLGGDNINNNAKINSYTK